MRDLTRAREDMKAIELKARHWRDRKKQFSVRQIKLAAEVLAAKGWIDAGAPRADR